jgi:hypothetical protein
VSLPTKNEEPCDFEAALIASEHPVWQDIVSHVYEAFYGPRGHEVLSVTPVAKPLQAHVVDYSVALKSPYTGETIESLCELKVEGFPANNIVVERWSIVEAGKEGWAFKPVDIHTQRLLTVFEDGTCFFPFLDDYKCYLTSGPLRKYDDARASGLPPPYRTLTPSSKDERGTWTTESFLLPVSELRAEFGKRPFYKLEGDWASLAYDAVQTIKTANRGGAK